MADDFAKEHIKQADALAMERTAFDAHWDEIRCNISPQADAVPSRRGQAKPAGGKLHQFVFDNSAETTSEIFAAGLNGLLTNAGTKWFGIRAIDDRVNNDPAARAWLEIVRDRMIAVLNSPDSGFYGEVGKIYQEIGDFGTGSMFVFERPGRLPLFQARPIAEIFLAENDENRIDLTYRRFRMSARAAVKKWGNAVGTRAVERAGKVTAATDEIEFLQAIHPRTDRVPNSRRASNKPFANVFINVDEKHTISVGGFDEFPGALPRWKTRAGEGYGRGPGMKALADVKMLQRAMKATIRGVEKGVNPALIAPDDGVLGPISVKDNAVNFVRAELLQGRQKPIQALDSGTRPELGDIFMAGVRERIDRAYFLPFFQMIRDPRATATQVLEITQENLQILGPFIGNIQREFLGPIIQRLYAVMIRAGMFPPVPAILDRQQLNVEYESPAAMAQRLSEVTTWARFVDLTGQAAALSGDQTVWDNVDLDVGTRRTHERLGVWADVIRPERLVQEMRDRRRQVQEEAAAAEQFSQVAPGMQSVAQAAAALTPESEVGGNA